MSNMINGWLGGSVVPACGHVAMAAHTPARTRATDVAVAVKATHGAFEATPWATTPGRPAWSPLTT